MESVFAEWKGLLKHKSRISDTHKNKEHKFTDRLDDLFDIAHTEAMSLITIPQDKEFLLRQREKGRQGSLGALDKVYAGKVQRAKDCRRAAVNRKMKSDLDIEAGTSQAILVSNTDDDLEQNESSDESDHEFAHTEEVGAVGGGGAAAALKRAKINIMTRGTPEILLFKRFKEQWRFIDPDNFYVENLVATSRIISFATKHLEVHQPRDDYQEFRELSLIFLGSSPKSGIQFHGPGAMYRARWLAKVLYSIKIWLFHEQFKMTAAERRDRSIFCPCVPQGLDDSTAGC